MRRHAIRQASGLVPSALIGAACLSLAATATPAAAQSIDGGGLKCSPRKMMVAHLNDKYGERLRGAGVHGPSGVMELYVSRSGGWTLLLTRPDGQSCPVAVGDDWRDASRRPDRREDNAPI